MQGETVGHWRIEQHIGAGAMGTVYRATDLRSGTRAAVKFMQADPGDDGFAEAEARFSREAQVLARLRHQNIVQILDSGEHGSQPYLVMEYIASPSLRELQRLGRQFSLDDVAHIGFQLLSGLGLCHSQGVIHRDIKPSNIMLRDGDRVVLVDFGIARADNQVGITLTGAAFGTPAYMSPEQTEGRTVTPASDVWSVGVVLYELLTGQLPFGGDNPLALMNHIRLTAHPDPSVYDPALGEPVDALFRIALAKAPWQRFPARPGTAGSTPALEFQKALLLAVEGAKDPSHAGWRSFIPPPARTGPGSAGAVAPYAAPVLSAQQQAGLDDLRDEMDEARAEWEEALERIDQLGPHASTPWSVRLFLIDWAKVFFAAMLVATAIPLLLKATGPGSVAGILVLLCLLAAVLSVALPPVLHLRRIAVAASAHAEQLAELQEAARACQQRHTQLEAAYRSALLQAGHSGRVPPGPHGHATPGLPANPAQAHLARLQDELEDLRVELEAARHEMETHPPFNAKALAQTDYGPLFARCWFVFVVLFFALAIVLSLQQESDEGQVNAAMGMASGGSLFLALFYCGCDYYYRVIRARHNSVAELRRKVREFEHARQRYRDALADYQSACQQFGATP